VNLFKKNENPELLCKLKAVMNVGEILKMSPVMFPRFNVDMRLDFSKASSNL
jgi:hypothetical protein